MRRPDTITKILFVVAVIGVIVWVNAGSLTPPAGPVAPTMKPLNQVEPRTPITALPVTLSQSGSYYLVSNLTGVSGQHGILIGASDVTIDLCGFTLAGVSGSLNGIYVSQGQPPYNLAIRNGVFRGWGSAAINADPSRNIQLDHLRLYSNNDGIVTGTNSDIQDCTLESSGGISVIGTGRIRDCICRAGSTYGIYADGPVTVTGCTVQGGKGILVSLASTLSDCTVTASTENGIQTPDNCLITRCVAQSCTLHGMLVGARNRLSGCMASGNGQNGVTTGDDCMLSGCIADANAGNGLQLGAGCTADECQASSNGAGSSGIGINAAEHCTIRDSITRLNRYSGIVVAGDAVVAHNHSIANGGNGTGVGILSLGVGNRIEANHLRDNSGAGIFAGLNVNSVIIGNSASNNGGSNYSFYNGNNDYGPVGTPSGATSPFTNFQ